MTDLDLPALTFILAVPTSYPDVKRVIQALQAQTKRNSLEVILVTPSTGNLKANLEDLAMFHSYQILETRDVVSNARASAEGIRFARAPLIVTGEDHSFPAPDWAEVLIDAHRGPWAGVGPVIRNANPGNVVSWAQLLIEYGPWLEPVEGGEKPTLPGHNTCYKRELLMDYPPDELEQMLMQQSAMHLELLDQGHRLYLCPQAIVYHLNQWQHVPWLRDEFRASWKYAGTRSRKWSLWRRLVYAIAAPLIPIVRMRRLMADLRRLQESDSLFPRVVPNLLLCLAISATAEGYGYLRGSPSAASAESTFLFGRAQRLPSAEWHPDLRL